MPKFESELGEQSFVGKPLREFDVADESGYSEPPRRSNQPIMVPMDAEAIRNFQNKLNGQNSQQNQYEVEEEIRAERQAKKTGKVRLNEGARRRIDMLIGMTRLTREVDIEGAVYVLRTLKSGEMREAIAEASKFDGTVQSPFEVRKQLIGRSLTQIAGVDVEQFIGSNLLEDKFTLIDELDEPLLIRLYDEYVELSKEAKDKYSIKTPEEAKEVLEDLKK